MGSLVNVKEATVITPSDQTPSTVLSLSALDSQLFLRFTIEYLLVYSPVSDPVSLSGRLKSALSRALVPYFPFSGRVRDGGGGSLLRRRRRGGRIRTASHVVAAVRAGPHPVEVVRAAV